MFHGTLLVAMPNGFGVYRTGGVAPAHNPRSPGCPHREARDRSERLRSARFSAWRRLPGNRLTLPPVNAAPASGTSSVFGGPLSWLGWGVGAALIALAWTTSLRARPARPARGADSPG